MKLSAKNIKCIKNNDIYFCVIVYFDLINHISLLDVTLYKMNVIRY